MELKFPIPMNLAWVDHDHSQYNSHGMWNREIQPDKPCSKADSEETTWKMTP